MCLMKDTISVIVYDIEKNCIPYRLVIFLMRKIIKNQCKVGIESFQNIFEAKKSSFEAYGSIFLLRAHSRLAYDPRES